MSEVCVLGNRVLACSVGLGLALAACARDRDGDGWDETLDCNDFDATISPDADEVCDGIDNNCNGRIDDDDPAVVADGAWYADPEGDGSGSGEIVSVCEPVDGAVYIAHE